MPTDQAFVLQDKSNGFRAAITTIPVTHVYQKAFPSIHLRGLGHIQDFRIPEEKPQKTLSKGKKDEKEQEQQTRRTKTEIGDCSHQRSRSKLSDEIL